MFERSGRDGCTDKRILGGRANNVSELTERWQIADTALQLYITTRSVRRGFPAKPDAHLVLFVQPFVRNRLRLPVYGKSVASIGSGVHIRSDQGCPPARIRGTHPSEGACFLRVREASPSEQREPLPHSEGNASLRSGTSEDVSPNATAFSRNVNPSVPYERKLFAAL